MNKRAPQAHAILYKVIHLSVLLFGSHIHLAKLYNTWPMDGNYWCKHRTRKGAAVILQCVIVCRSTSGAERLKADSHQTRNVT